MTGLGCLLLPLSILIWLFEQLCGGLDWLVAWLRRLKGKSP